jgi:hypothetical protein
MDKIVINADEAKNTAFEELFKKLSSSKKGPTQYINCSFLTDPT